MSIGPESCPGCTYSGHSHLEGCPNGLLSARRYADDFDAPHDAALRKVIPAKYLGTSLKEAAAEHIKALTKLIDAADYLQHCRRSESTSRNYGALGVVETQKRIQRASDHYDFLRDQVKL